MKTMGQIIYESWALSWGPTGNMYGTESWEYLNNHEKKRWENIANDVRTAIANRELQ